MNRGADNVALQKMNYSTPKCLAIAVLVVCSALVPRALAAELNGSAAPTGPLVTRNLYAYYLPFINLSPESSRTVPAGRLRFTMVNSYANTFRWDPGLIRPDLILQTDLENYFLSCQLDGGIGPRLDIGAAICFNIAYGGIFDPLIQGFHGFLNLPNQGRETVSDNRFLVHVENSNGTWMDCDRLRAGLGHVTLRTKFNFLHLHDSLLSLRAALKIPAGASTALFNSGKFDFALHLLADQRLGPFILYLNIGWIYLGKPESLKIFDFRNHLFGYSLCIEWLAASRLSVVTQVDGRTSPYISGEYFLDRHCSTITTGVSLRLDETKALQFSFIEEFFTASSVETGINATLLIDF